MQADKIRIAVRIGIVILVLFVLIVLAQRGSTGVLSYNDFQSELRRGNVVEIEVAGQTLRGGFKEPRGGQLRFVVQRVDLALAKELDRAGVRYFASPDHGEWSSLFGWLLPGLGLFLLATMLMRRFAGGPGAAGNALALGKSKAKIYVEADTRVTFSDVAGVDEAKSELQEIVDFLKDPKQHGRLGARMPKGVLLVGPPGTGKTLLARAVAGEAGVPFFSINGSEFVEMFVGVGAARVRDLFEQARAKAPSIIFIDELDALGRARNVPGYPGGHDEKEQTLNQLLSELDGFDPSLGVVMLAATNRPEILDPALLRSGRFDRQVLVDRPDRPGRVAILRVHVRKIALAADIDLDTVASLTPGFTGADLANLCNEAALTATRRGASSISLDDFTAAIERIVAGLEKKNRLLNPRERTIVAHHEAGHALLAHVLSEGERVQKVSIIPRGIGALGYTLRRPTEDRYLMTRQELEQKLVVLMGGRAAERLVFGHLSTGAADDLVKATEIARSMATRYGMVPELGHVAFEPEAAPLLGWTSGGGFNPRTYSDASAHAIEAQVKAILDRAFERAEAILTSNRSVLDRAARELLERETLTEAQLDELLRGVRLPEQRALQLGAA